VGIIVPHFGNADIIAANFTRKGESKMNRCLLVLMLLSVSSLTALADIAKPTTPKPKAIDTFLSIRLQSDAKEARLIIPKSQLMELRAQLDQLGGPNDTAAAFTASGMGSRLPTIVAGLFLTLSIVFAGLWFARSGRLAPGTGSSMILLAVIMAAGSAATLVYGNAGPPPEARSITGKMFTQAVHMYGFGSGQIKLETSDDPNQRLELIVPDPKTTPTPNE
jgi:hypothetical protein